MITRGGVSQIIYMAAQLGLADLLMEGAKSSRELAEAADGEADARYRVRRARAGLGRFAENESKGFARTPLASFLRRTELGAR